jgi:hypothetical protein
MSCHSLTLLPSHPQTPKEEGMPRVGAELREDKLVFIIGDMGTTGLTDRTGGA